MKNFTLNLVILLSIFGITDLLGQSNGYCPAYNNNPCEAIIINVQFANINRPSGCDVIDGYDDYVPTDTAYLAPTDVQVMTVTVDPGANLLYTEQVTMWIDWNGNKIYDYFLEPDELYTLSGNTAAGIYTTTVTVPPTAVNDSTLLLRIVDGFLTPNFTDFCDSLIVSYEVEDYAIVVTATPPSSGGAGYCAATGTPTCSDGTNTNFIENVAITGEFGSAIDNTTACDAGYGDFTAQSVVLSQGLAYTLSVLENNPDPTIFGTVNIDWNQDGIFDVTEEIDMLSPGVVPNSVAITVPVDALLGATRMRIVIENGTGDFSIGACDNPVSGEVEDYTVIVSAPTDNSPECPNKLSPSNNNLTVCLNTELIWNSVANADKYQYILRKADGTIILEDSTSTGLDTTVTVLGLDTNTVYYWTVLAQEAGSVSLSCQAFQFTTVPYLGPTITFDIPNPYFQCALAPVNLEAIPTDATGPYSYLWSGTDADSLNRLDTNAVTFTSTTIGDYQITLLTTDANGCISNDTLNLSFVNAADKGSLTIADTTICFGDSSTIILAGLVGTPFFQVTQDTSGVISWTDTILQSDVANEFYTIVTADTLFYRYIADAGGCNDTSAVFGIYSLALPTDPNIIQIGADTICANDTLLLVVDNYTTGLVWDDILSTTNDTLNIVQTGTYTVTYTDLDGCISSATSADLAVNALPAKPVISTTNTLPACVGTVVTLTTADVNNPTWNDIATTTNDTLNVVADGDYVVMVTNAEGCIQNSDTLSIVFVTTSPKPTITENAPTNFCDGEEVLLIASTSTAILWSDGVTTNDSLIVTTSGDYFVTVNPGSACATNSDTLSYIFKPLPGAPNITAPNGTTTCQGSTVTLVSDSTTNIIWNDVSSTTSATLTVGVSGEYVVTYTAANGCSASSDTTFVTIDMGPSRPVISQIGNDLVVDSPTAAYYQWIGPAGVISGENGTSYTPSVKGNYYAIAYSAIGCGSSPSNPVFFSGTGINEQADVSSLMVYPNPASSFINVLFDGAFDVEVITLDGKRIIMQQDNFNEIKLDLNVGSGVYLIRVSSEQTSVVKPIVIN